MKKLYLISILSIVLSLAVSSPGFAMHISEGILPMQWALLWFLVAIPFLIKGISDIKKKSKATPGFKPFLSMMGAVVFIISCMPVPVPTAGTCSHPCGTAMSAILINPVISVVVASIALLFQALFLAHGGLTTLAANIVSMGIVGSFTGYATFKILQRFNASLFISAFLAGLLADWATYAATSFELALALHGTKPIFPLFTTILISFIPTQLPLGILEGFLTGGMVVFVYKRRPDILASLGVIKKSIKPIIKNRIKVIFILIVFLSIFIVNHFAFAEENKDKWRGVDESVVEKVAEEHNRTAWKPFINTDQGDLLLFVFLLAGTIGGFVFGYNFRKLFIEKSDLNYGERSIQ